MAVPLVYGLWKLTTRNTETTQAQPKIQEPDLPAYQPNRHHQNESVIPNGPSNISWNTRDVYLASRVVGGGLGGGALAELEKYYGGAAKAVLTSGLTVFLDDAPDPTHHWCIVVGGYLHQLQATSLIGGYNYYTNEHFNPGQGWSKYKVGTTTFNDEAIRNSAAKAMNEMLEIYHAFNNNCQHFALRLADKILRDGRKKYKLVNQTYGRMAQEPLPMPMNTKVYKIGEEPPAEDDTEQAGKVIIKPEPVKRPALSQEEIEGVDRDEDDQIAVVEDEEAHSKMLDEVVKIMVENTPSIQEVKSEEAKAN